MEIANSNQAPSPVDTASPAVRQNPVATLASNISANQNPVGMESLVANPAALTNTLLAALQSAAARQGGMATLLLDLVQAQSLPVVPAQVQAAITKVLDVSAPLRTLETEDEVSVALTGSDAVQTRNPGSTTSQPPLLAAPVLPLVSAIRAALVNLQQSLDTWSSDAEVTPPQANAAPTQPVAANPLPSIPAGIPAATTLSGQPTPVRATPAATEPSQPPSGTEVVSQVVLASRQLQANPLAPAATVQQAIVSTAPVIQPTPTQSETPDIADATAALLVLQQSVKLPNPNSNRTHGSGPRAEPVASANARETSLLLPGYRKTPSNAPPPQLAKLPSDAEASAVARILGQRTESALTQVKLIEISTQLRQPSDRQSATASHDPAWTFELPLPTPHGEAKGKFEVSRESYKGKSGVHAQVWRARFSINVEPLGPVHADVALLGKNAWVSIFAERESSMQTLEAQQQLLQHSFRAENVAAEVTCNLGSPPPRPVSSTRLLDSIA